MEITNPHRLVFEEQELEARLGFQPGKYTNPNKTLAFLIAGVLWFAFYTALHFLPPEIRSHRLVSIFTERGSIQYITSYAFLWGLILVWLKSRKAEVQSSALRILLNKNFGCYRFAPDNAEQWHTWVNRLADKPQKYMLLNRLRVAFASLANMRDPGGLPEILNHHAESDELQIESSYSLIQTLLYAIPVLGFIGTVLGLGNAIGGFGHTLSAGTENLNGLIESLQAVAGGLSVAFDTTLLALIASLILQIYTSFERAQESAFLEDCNFFIQNEFYPNLRPCANPEETAPWQPLGT
ncbi:MotA/TolQ/ExbB proton channel family protein [Coraliomargarita parva]|uniref:MotA/TolQ/ExbB proton channel family protein n=1 Tax=Coraliomargarita parva TaxID=3014050 RepID=UPI0022B358D3|nr:MotA/TolQ/ExbB proton channel family protein [Coraliomargarita parva]